MAKQLSIKGITLQRANKLLKIDENKLDRYMLYYADELLRSPDPNNPNAPALNEIEQSVKEVMRRVMYSANGLSTTAD